MAKDNRTSITANRDANQLSASDAVFRTYELLESIILELPAEDVLFAAKVDKTWSSVITSSESIRYHIQKNLPMRRQYVNHKPASKDWFISRHFLWAWVLIHRAGGCEAIALLPTKRTRLLCARWTRLLRAVIVDGQDMKPDITWVAKREGWKLKFCDEIEGIYNSGFVESAGSGVGIRGYLERYYGGFYLTKRKAPS